MNDRIAIIAAAAMAYAANVEPADPAMPEDAANVWGTYCAGLNTGNRPTVAPVREVQP